MAICCDLPTTVRLSASPMRSAVLPRFALDLWWQVERVAAALRKQHLDKEISNRIAKASASYGRLHTRVWNEMGLKLETKRRVYRAVVLTALLYGCESWTVYRRHVKLLDQFHQRCLRRILNIKWYHRVSNVKVLLQAQMLSIDALLTGVMAEWLRRRTSNPDGPEVVGSNPGSAW
ncbi:hypothetical protein ACOMHN_065816 [Nucella lapillus]